MFKALVTAAPSGTGIGSKVAEPQAVEETASGKKGGKTKKGVAKASAKGTPVQLPANVAEEMTYTKAEALFQQLWQEHMIKAMDENLYPMDEQDLRFSTAINLEMIRSRHFCVIGVGGIGAPIVRNLVGMGARNITIIDYDTVDIHNVGPQGYALADIGKLKVHALHDEIMRHRGISVNVINRKVEGYHHLLELSNRVAPEVLILAIDHLQSRTEIIKPILNNLSSVLSGGVAPGLDTDRLRISTPMYTIVTAMTLGLWNVYTLPCRALMTEQSPDGPGLTPDLRAARKRFIEKEVTPRLVFKDEEAVQESCTARSIIYTGSTIAGYVCAMMHWCCGNENVLYLDQGMSEFNDLGALSDIPFKWMRVFNARTFQDGMMSPAFLREMNQCGKLMEELMRVQEQQEAWKNTVREISGLYFPSSLQELIDTNLVGKMVRVPVTSGPILRCDTGKSIAREDLWMYVVVDYHSTDQCSAVSLMYDRRASMRGQAFGYGSEKDDAARGKLQTLYGILFDGFGNLVCPVTQKTEDETGHDGLPMGYSSTADKSKNYLAGGGAFQFLMWGMPRKDIQCVRTPSPLERSKVAKVASIGAGESAVRVEDLKVGNVLRLPPAGGRHKDTDYVLLGIGAIKTGVSAIPGMPGMPSGTIGHMPSLVSGLYCMTLVMMSVQAMDSATTAAGVPFRRMVYDLEMQSRNPGFRVDITVHEAVDTQTPNVTKMNTAKHLSALVRIDEGDPLGLFTEGGQQATAAEAAPVTGEQPVAADPGVVNAWDRTIYPQEELPGAVAHRDITASGGMWLDVVPVHTGARVQWRQPNDQGINEDVVGRMIILDGAPSLNALYVELTVRQIWVRADACLVGVLG